MGCDIHLRVERRNDSGRWVDVLPPETWNNEALDDKTPRGAHYFGHWFVDQNYHLFALLADVRNDGHTIPICKPRGLPEDVATKEDLNDEGEGWWWGDHSHSWLALSELEQLRSVVVAYTGVLDVAEYDRWKASGDLFPKDWCKSVKGPGIVTCKEDELFMSRGKSGGFSLLPKATHVEAKWAARGSEALERFLRFVDYLQRYGKPEDVRLVFGFDS